MDNSTLKLISPEMTFNVLAGVSALLALVLLRSILERRRNPSGLPLPPGPKGLPMFGNLFDVSKEDKHLQYAEMAKKYGDLVCLDYIGNKFLYISNYKHAVELLEGRSSIYSSRPEWNMLANLMGWRWALPTMKYGENFKKHRLFLKKFLQASAVRRYTALQTRETTRLLSNLLKSPDNYVHHLRTSAGATVLMISYGHEVADENDFFVNLADKCLGPFSLAGNIGHFLVDYIPSLQHVPAWLPGAGFRRKANEWSKDSRRLLTVPYEMTKERIAKGSANESMVSQLLEEHTRPDGSVEHESVIMGCAGVAYLGGADTTVSAIMSALLAMVLNPEIQKRAQEEIDHVMGKERIPTIDDRNSLPYVHGIVKESLRWNPVVPLNTTHTSISDDVYEGYFIPKGTGVVVNNWALLHDETEYPESNKFKPERWIPQSGKKIPRDSSKVAFGFGRRLCPGLDLAENSIFLTVSSILATLDISKALDESGKEITPSGKYITGFGSYPEPFQCAIKPRSERHVQLIMTTAASEGLDKN